MFAELNWDEMWLPMTLSSGRGRLLRKIVTVNVLPTDLEWPVLRSRQVSLWTGGIIHLPPLHSTSHNFHPRDVTVVSTRLACK